MIEPEQLAKALGDRYRVDRELGRGGMAVVYLAEDLKHERMVALKVLRPELTAALGAERFLREIKITARLDHPHILPLLDSGEAGDILYYVMPHVEGESLRDRMGREGQLPLEDALQMAQEVADALGYAHSHDVIHRDIKPENILLSGGHARVADFGIARAITTAAGGRLTETGIAIGTPLYMSPEQLSAEGALDGRSDLYSLGVVLYEMLAGEPPYTGPTAQAVLARKSSGDIPKISTIREAVPSGVEAAVLRALAKTPADRFVTAQQFSQALVPSTDGSPPVSPKKRGSSIKLAATAVVVLVVVALGATGRLPWMVRPAAAEFFNERDPVVVAEFENQTDQPAMGLALREAVTTDLDQSPYVTVVDRAELATVLDRMRLADTVELGVAIATEIARREGYPAVVAGSVTQLGDGYQLAVRIIEASTGNVAIRLRETAADKGEVVDALEKLVRLARRHLGESLGSVRRSEPLPAVTTASLEALQLSAEGTVYGYRGEYEAAISLLEQAVRIDTAFAAAYRGLSIYNQILGNPSAAQANADLAFRFSDRLTMRERYLVSSTYHNRRGRLDSVAYYHLRLLERFPENYTALNNLGDTYERMGRYEQALELYRRAIRISISSSGLVNVASASRTLGQHALADSMSERLWTDYPTTWSTWSSQYMNALYALDERQMEQIAGDMSVHEFPFPRGYGRWARSGHRAMHG
jgi:serine/threonine-protein kinase